MRQIFAGFSKVLAVVLAMVVLAACAGGGGTGGSSVTVPGMTTATVTGSITGGTFAAFDATTGMAMGSVAASADLSGGKSFSLPLPAGRTYKFYIIENDGTASARVFPVYWGATNKFAVLAITAVDLGFISTVTGVAQSGNDPTKASGVTGSGEDKTIPGALAGSAFAVSDLAGSWNVQQITAGTGAGWQSSMVSIDASGTAAAASYESSAGSGTTPSVTYSIYPSGVVTFPGGTGTGFRGIMTKDKSMIVGTISPAGGDYAMIVMCRGGATYGQADLQGTWSLGQLITGASPAWTHGYATIDASGTMSITGETRSSGSGSTPAATLTIDATGSVASNAWTSFSGVLSQDKNLMVAVATNPDGTFSLMTLTRTGGASFAAGDLVGIWRTDWLSAGNGPNTPYYGSALFASDGLVNDAYGDIAATMTSIQLSSVAQADYALTVALSSTGYASFKNTDYFGAMSIAKNLMVGIWTESNGSPSLYVFVK